MFEDIETFQAIAQHQSLTKASKVLGISTPVVTRRLARLEKSLGTQLVQRTTRQVKLTEAGELFFLQISDVLQGLEASKEAVKNLTNNVAGTLRVGLPPSLSYLYVTKMLPKFIREYPNIHLEIATGNYLLNLLTGGFDLVIHAGVLPDSSFYYKQIGSWKRIFCASADYLKRHEMPRTPEDLKSHFCIDHLSNTERTWEYTKNNINKKIMIDGGVRIDNNFDIKQLALEGVGIAYLSKCTVHEDIKQKKLIPILEDFSGSEMKIYAVYPSKKFISKKAQIFLTFMEDLLKSVHGEMSA